MSSEEEGSVRTFPAWALLPKRETGAAEFARKRPESDGRGTTIVIFDSGVDPNAKGLQETSDGRVKVVERFDCSGCGDVDTGTAATLKDGQLTGVTGRKLQIPSTWINPSGEWRIGVLHPFILYPSKLVERVKEHRKEFLWDEKHKLATATALRELQDFESKHTSTTLSLEDKLLKEELEAQAEILANLEKKYNDVGPSYDCVLFNDGQVWRACIDTSEVGDLEKGVLLGEYSKTHDHAHLTRVDLMTISINVHNNGNVLEVVGMCSSHGTHVASIASGYFPKNPDLNGLAPGAQIISLGIGDGRLGSMETGTSLVRACIKVMELSATMKIDVINMSYGEHAHWSDSGRIGDLMNEVINKYGIVWVVSAGNHGPALSTVGAPPDIQESNMIGVGAYVSPSMMNAIYSMKSKLNGSAYSWSSRGPCIDGAMGVSICAPGGAITSVPNFTLRGTQMMNGTSMSAPHVSGAISAIISGLKQDKIPYSPYSIKRALENTAQVVKDVEPFAQGCGLLDIVKAFDSLCKYSDSAEMDVRFKISCGRNSTKGIYFRRGVQDTPKDVVVIVEPAFNSDFKNPEGIESNWKKIEFDMRLTLSCDAFWVECPTFLFLMNLARTFIVKISAEKLPPGVHHTSIKAYDTKCTAKGPVFQIPVTVIQPEPLSTDNSGGPCLSVDNYTFQPGSIKRHFVDVPQYATWAVLKMSSEEKPGRFMVHCMQLIPRMNCKSCEFQKMVNIVVNSESVLPFQVKGGYIMEVVISKYWANLDAMSLNYSIEFHGIKPENNPIVFHGADGVHCVKLHALRREECLPLATLKHTVQPIRPSESKIGPLSERDVIPPGRQIYEIINTYNIYITKGTVEITPNVPVLSDALYESEFESQLWMLFDSNKQYIASGDSCPSKYTVKLEKGDYVLKLSIRHERKDLLEKFADTPILMSIKLSQCLTLDIFNSHSQVFTGKKSMGVVIAPGAVFPVYMNSISSEKVGKNLTVGQYLSGYVTFAKDELGRKVDTYCIKYILPEHVKKASNGSPGKDKDKTKAEEYSEALRDLKTFWLGKLEGEPAQKLYDEITESYPDHLHAHVAYINSLDPSSDLRKLPAPHPVADWTKANCEKIVGLANQVIASIDLDMLLAYYGMKNDLRPEAVKIKLQQEKQRNLSLEALNKKGIALCKMHILADNSVEDAKPLMDEIKETMMEVSKIAELTDTKVLHFALWHSVVMGQFGRSVRFLNKILEDHPTSEVEEKLIQFYNALDWEHVAAFATSALPRKFPTAYRLF